MRVTADARRLDVDPASTATISVDVVNTNAVIDGVSARVIGLPEQCVTAQPALLPLFPDASGRITLELAVPASLAAGRHPLSIEVLSHGAQLPSAFLDVDLDVRSRPSGALLPRPKVIRARRGARFVLEVANRGNVALDVALEAADADRAVTTRFTPASLRVPPGTTTAVLMHVRGPRMITGTELERTVTVTADARVAGVPDGVEAAAVASAAGPGAAGPAEPGGPEPSALVPDTTVRLRQRPLLSRGLLTALILAGIVGLWAGVFLLGLNKVFSGDPMTKQAPASFFVADATGAGAPGASGAAQPGSAGSGGAAPAGALPKTGQMPPGTGGSISGTVSAASDGQPVSRILVRALRPTRDGVALAGSAATQSDGSYTVAGLFPTGYYLQFSAPGFKTVWYPSAPSRAGAEAVDARAQTVTSGVDVTITGLPADISGHVSPGDALEPVTTTVTARALRGAATDRPAATTTTQADGSYRLTDLPAPGTYELTFTTPGYQPSTLVDTVNGGDQRLEPTVTLGATPGQIAGTVSDGHGRLGGVTVGTTAGGQARTVTTPTSGQVGHYVLGNLPTPGTYVITFSAPGHGAQTKIVDLTAGQSRPDVDVTLASGTGSVTGTLTDADGNGLGGATVTVGGTATTAGTAPPSTVTLTSDTGKGTFVINGLDAPGRYTLTFSLAGYQSTTIPISLRADAPAPKVTASLAAQNGSISGTVVDPAGKSLAGATVVASDGRNSWHSTSTDSGFTISGLAPGHYAVTASLGGRAPQTALVVVGANRPAHARLTLAPGSATS